ncbi:hypothetical protein FRC09_018691, partial [Ceratobasidium sp. 395]
KGTARTQGAGIVGLLEPRSRHAGWLWPFDVHAERAKSYSHWCAARTGRRGRGVTIQAQLAGVVPEAGLRCCALGSMMGNPSRGCVVSCYALYSAQRAVTARLTGSAHRSGVCLRSGARHVDYPIQGGQTAREGVGRGGIAQRGKATERVRAAYRLCAQRKTYLPGNDKVGTAYLVAGGLWENKVGGWSELTQCTQEAE